MAAVDGTHQHDDGGGSDEGVQEASLQGQPAAAGKSHVLNRDTSGSGKIKKIKNSHGITRFL